VIEVCPSAFVGIARLSITGAAVGLADTAGARLLAAADVFTIPERRFCAAVSLGELEGFST
jgi:hypothetical protein